MSIWILNGSIWNEATASLESKHIQIENGMISAIVDAADQVATEGFEVIDAAGNSYRQASSICTCIYVIQALHIRKIS